MAHSESKRMAIVTPSYRNDLEYAATLARSVDRYTETDFEHILVVPRADMSLFAGLQTPRRRIVAQEALLSRYGVHPLPLPNTVRIPFRGRKRIHSQWFAWRHGRVSGWLAQQLIKLSCPELTERDLIVYADSDVELVRPLIAEHFLSESGAIALQRSPLRGELAQHLRWLASARQLNGVSAPTSRRAYNYVGQLVSWRLENVLNLRAHLEQVHARPWFDALLRAEDVSEYMIYGVYCDEVVGEASGHVAVDPWLTCSIWTTPSERLEAALARAILPSHVAVHVQSAIDLDAQTRRAAIDAALELTR